MKGETTMIDVNKLTLGEIAKVEDLSGLPIAAFENEDKPKGLALAALAFVWRRRSVPAFTWNDALDLPLDEAQKILGITDETDDEHTDTTGENAGEVPQADPFGSES